MIKRHNISNTLYIILIRAIIKENIGFKISKIYQEFLESTETTFTKVEKGIEKDYKIDIC